MITEDYVSFEVAKLLKEKGFGEKFDEFCPYSYSTILPNSPYFGETDLRKGSLEHQIYAPTLQMAMKWLREMHNIVIEINMDDYMITTDGKLKVTYSYTIWTFIKHLRHLEENGLLTDARYDDRAFWQENVKVGQSYEQAVKAAIEYCLTNLI